MTIKKNDKFYYARIVPTCGIYDVYELKVRAVYESYFVCIEKRDKHAYLFYENDIGKTLFHNRNDALEKVIEAEKNKKIISNETYYEEY